MKSEKIEKLNAIANNFSKEKSAEDTAAKNEVNQLSKHIIYDIAPKVLEILEEIIACQNVATQIPGSNPIRSDLFHRIAELPKMTDKKPYYMITLDISGEYPCDPYYDPTVSYDPYHDAKYAYEFYKYPRPFAFCCHHTILQLFIYPAKRTVKIVTDDILGKSPRDFNIMIKSLEYFINDAKSIINDTLALEKPER